MYHYPAITADVAVLNWIDSDLKILLILRKNTPFKDCWALPGGFIELDETLETSAHRELEEETGLTNLQLEQVAVFGDPGRDPRGRTVTVVYRTLLIEYKEQVVGQDDAKDAGWFSLHDLPQLAFDHDMIISHVLHNFKHDIFCQYSLKGKLNAEILSQIKEWFDKPSISNLNTSLDE